MSAREAWRDDAACRGEATSVFFPDASQPAAPALAICRNCPVRAPCLAYAIENHIVHGVWGGASVRRRRALQRHDWKAS